MSILRRDWAKYQQLLITHPWKTQNTGTGIVIILLISRQIHLTQMSSEMCAKSIIAVK